MSQLKSYAYPGIGEWARENLSYSQAIRVRNQIVCAGQGRWDPSPAKIDLSSLIKKDLMEEIDQAFSNVDHNLKHAGGKGWEQVYKLTFQQNNAVEDEDDARDKYVARQLFRHLASEGYLGSKSTEDHDTVFRIFSEDLRPSNVLIDKDLKVVGVIDWEFAYAAPAEFSSDPPWWLLLKYPGYWPDGYEKWMQAYESRFKAFISVLQDEERKLKAGRKVEDDLKAQKQLAALVPFVELKMRHEKERKLVQWSEKNPKAELCKIMV
ncbi:hypothetical protein IL306_004785 [Fusarium sp. DS 682]|nr:hypothetical protein IL306_004785 [Fusarium sp. DS 682]